jgi:hypothetical protein
MVAKHLANFDTTAGVIPAGDRHRVQAHALFHWLTYVNGFTLIEASGANWSTLVHSASDGVINSGTPQQFFTASATFDATFVDQHIAIRDTTNPTNCFVARITALVSPTQVTLDSSAVLNVSATNVDFRVFDSIAAPPADADYFVIENPAASSVAWQARCIVRTAVTSLEWELGFIGGWNVGTTSWDLTVSTGHYMHTDIAQTFCVADAQVGWLCAWSETNPGGVAASRNAVWLGVLSPFHAPVEVGVPKDTQYSAIFGTSLAAPASNLSRSTAVTANFVVGEMLDDALAVIPVYVAQKRLLSSGNDLMANAAASLNPFSSLSDDYDAIAFHRAPDQAWRGRIPGLRILNDSIANRTPLNANLTYVLGSGLGVVWDGKAPLP